MIPFVKYLWKNGYTNIIGTTTTMVTVILMDVAVCACASEAASDAAEAVLLTNAFKELAEFM
jgi:hypothetical protein